MYAFDYHRPKSVAEAVTLLAGAADAKLLAGGQTLIPTLKQRLAQPSDVIDLGGIAELKGIKEEGGRLIIGAMTTPLPRSPNPRPCKPRDPGARRSSPRTSATPRSATAARSAARSATTIRPPTIRRRCWRLGATVSTNKREITADDFFTGMFETALEDGRDRHGGAASPSRTRAGYVKFPNPASRYAMVGVFVAQTGGGVRVAVTGAGPCVFRLDRGRAGARRELLAGRDRWR